MGWDALIFGELKLDAKAREKWLKSEADSGKVPGIAKHVSSERFGPKPVPDAVAELEKLAVDRRDTRPTRTRRRGDQQLHHFEIDTAGGLRVAAILSKDDYLDWAPAIAALFQAALASGGQGELVLCGLDPGLEAADFGYVMRGSKLVPLENAETDALAAHPEFLRLTSIFRGDETPAASTAWTLNPFTRKPVLVPKRDIADVELSRRKLREAGYDPDTGKPLT